MPIPLLFLAGAASALKGASTIAGGFQQRSANKAAALGAQIERDMALLRGKQISEQSRANLLTALGSINALRTTRGASLDSPTAQAIERRTAADAYRDEGAQVLGEITRAGAADQARRGFRKAASWAVPLSVLNASGDAMQAAAYMRGG